MKLKTKIYTGLLMLISICSSGQIEQYNYKRELTGISSQWHKIALPNEIFGKVSSDLYDIRIYGIKSNQDTVEAPYILYLNKEKVYNNEIDLKALNTSYNEKGYYYTFEIPAEEIVNQIKLEFNQSNFDWRLKLEGSQNQQEWFTIIENYRILSIKNELTDYQFSKIMFPNSKYRFFRILINSTEKPDLLSTKISMYEIIDGRYSNYTIEKVKSNEDKNNKQSEFEIDLGLPVPVSNIKIDVKDTFDYYRPIVIKYLTDSFETEQGWRYNYETLTTGTLNSIENNEFRFNSTILQKLKIVIHNQDNQVLEVDAFEVNGYEHDLFTRIIEPASYYLVYGSNYSVKPNYDIELFADKIPEHISVLELGNEQVIHKEKQSEIEPLFKNKNWLWAIMTVIILLLGWFSIKMIKKE